MGLENEWRAIYITHSWEWWAPVGIDDDGAGCGEWTDGVLPGRFELLSAT